MMADAEGEGGGERIVTEKDSVLVSSLTKSFKKILERDYDEEFTKDSLDKLKKTKKKKKDKDKKESTPAAPKKQKEKKTVLREGDNSLVTFPAPSSFSVFCQIRHFVLQQELCNMYNDRNVEGDDTEDEESDEEEEGEEGKKKTLPEVVNLGLCGVFTILEEIWQTNPELCHRVLAEFLNILQGQAPGGLKNEPIQSTATLFELLMKIVSDSSPSVDKLSSIASSCLISLVVALGQTSKILSAIAALFITPSDNSTEHLLKVPEIFRSLQVSVQAVLVGSPYDTDWFEQGVASKSLVDKWPLPLAKPSHSPSPLIGSITSDARHLYVHGQFGLMKVGSGYGNTIKGHVYESVSDFHNDEPGKLLFASGKLYYAPVGQSDIIVLDPDTLKIDTTMELDVEAIGPHCLFSDGTDLKQIMAKKEGGFSLRKLTTICSPIPVVEEKPLQLSQKSVIVLGRAKYDNQSNLHTLYQDNIQEVEHLAAARNIAIISTSSGKLYYEGVGVAVGVTGKDIPKGQWSEVDLPDAKVKIASVAVDNTGSFCLVVSDKGVVYFGGVNKKGEAGENAPVGRQQPKPVKLKRFNKVKDHEIRSCACGPHTTAMISKDGKLFMFGSLEDDIVDKTSGVVTGMLGVPASRVCLGRSHTVVLTQLGTVFTFGNNQYGQCGRNYIPPPEDNGLEAGDEEPDLMSDEEDEEDAQICGKDDHTWVNERCLICLYCKYCTGYGPSCCNEGMPDRDPGKDCGCGAGDSGCSTCGCCKVCSGLNDSWGGGMSYHELEDIDSDGYERVIRARSRSMSGKKEKKEDKGMGLNLLFGGGGDAESEEDLKEGGGAGEGASDQKVSELLSTKKAAVIPLPEDHTVMQISCGAFHTALLLHNGDVFVFGNGNHGQLGQGTNKPCGHPVKVPLPGPAQQVSCGDNHTVVLLSDGDVYTFGKHQEGQLGRSSTDDKDWNMTPGRVMLASDSYKAKWISASANQTFIAVDESLISEELLPKCQIFGQPDCIGLLPPTTHDELRPSLVVINPNTLLSKKLDGDEQEDLSGRSLCIDPEYNVLWSYNHGTNEMCCYNPVAAEVNDSEGTILSPSLCLPQSKGSAITQFHAALNLLSSLHTLSTNPPLSLQSLTGKKMKSFSVDDYHVISRFNTHGGGWGYNAGSIEAILFSPDQDVLLGGFGLYGGRGQYNVEVKVMEVGETPEEGEGTVIVSAEEKGYTCERNKTYKLLFERPVVLLAYHWYSVHAMIVSPSGASTDAGSSGMGETTGPDKVVFKFKSSRKSNNGTDVSSGQIPEILYRIPEFEQESGVSIQLLDKDFSLTVSPDGLQAVQNILEWSWSSLTQSISSVPLKLIVKCSLGIISAHIKEVYPARGINKKAPSDSLELAECVHRTLWIIKKIFSSRQSSLEQFQDIMATCRECFTSCFHAFYPSALLKWFSLCSLLQQIDPSDAIAGFPGDNLLSAVLDALSFPSYSYIGLSYDNSYNFDTVLHNSSQEERFPILTEFMQNKTLEDYSTGVEILSFTAVSTKLLSLVSGTLRAELAQQVLPSSVVVQKAGEFLISRINELALCSSYPEAASLSGLPLTSTKRKEKLQETGSRFSSREAGHPTQTVTDLYFTVNRPVLLNGVTVYGGAGDETYNYEAILLNKDGAVLVSHIGSFNRSDYYGDHDLVNLIFPESQKLEPDLNYIVRVVLSGASCYTVGFDGEMKVGGAGGVVFTFNPGDGGPVTDPTTGPVAKFLYSSQTATPQTIVQLSVHISSVLLDLTVSFLERILNNGLTEESVAILSSSFLLSKLLPTAIAHLGPIASLQPKSTVLVLDIIKRTLPIVSTVVKRLNGSSTPYTDAQHTHYAVVETDHPYKPSSVSHFKVKFPQGVSWMTIEFDPKCGFAQQEDKLASLLIPRTVGGASEVVTTETSVTPMIGISLEDLYTDFRHFGLQTPAGLVLVPGNEVHIVVNTETEYEKRDKSNHFGIKCKVIGHEWSPQPNECLSLLEKELVTLGAVCAGSLLSEDLNLPYPDELPVTTDPNDTEKADMRIVQAAAQEVLNDHSQLLGRGLYAKVSSVQSALRGDIQLITNNAEQQFLQDFIKNNPESSGGRLARWLQPDQSVDPSASDLELVNAEETPMVGKQVQLVVRTRDQEKQIVFVEGMNVEVKAEWKGKTGEDSPPNMRTGIDKVTGVRKPTYKRPFNPTTLGTNHVYQSISMMMPYTDYSFEELRFHAPKVLGSIESMAITSHNDGTYTVTWVPTSPGSYDIRVCIDGSLAGGSHTYEVLPAIPTEPDQKKEEEETKKQTKEEEEEEDNEETVVTETIKRKLFTGTKAQGLRVRAQPSFAAAAVGLIKPGYVLCYTDQVENDAGTWVKLTYDSLMELQCKKKEGYALSYSKAKNDDFLEDYEPKEIKRVIKKRGKAGKRQDGPGTYTVVQCGAAGHNIRSKPNMKGCPLGRLSKGSIIGAIEEVENDDGIWLKLSDDSLQKYAQQSALADSQTEAWTLVVHPSGRIFLAQDGDDSYQSSDFQSTAQAFPTAASVFGTPSSSSSLFGMSEVPPPLPPAPGFKFVSGPVKLAFGGVIEKEEGGKGGESSTLLFKFSGSDDKKGDEKKEEKKEKGDKEGKEKEEGEGKKDAAPVFSSGVEGNKVGRSGRLRRRVTINDDKKKDSTNEEQKDEDKEKEKPEKPDEEKEPAPPKEEIFKPVAPSLASPTVTLPKKRQALSPAVAECQRAIYAAFLWQEGLVHDAMASSLYLKFHPLVVKEEELATPTTYKKSEATPTDEVAKTDEKLPATLHHLVTFWEEMSQKVIDHTSSSFSPPKVPSFAQELLKRYEEEKKEMEKLKKEKEKKSGGGGIAAPGGGSTKCELCDVSFPDPVTYHMKDAHGGCGKHANGWGYNSRGSYCSGWAGNCGDGGRGGSTWYLMCKECHAKYLAQKEDNKKKVVKPISVPKMKTRKPGKPRSLPVISSVQGMMLNAKFLLEISTSVTSEGPKVKAGTSVSGGGPDFSRQVSTPEESVVDVTGGSVDTGPIFSKLDKTTKEEPSFRSSLPRHIPVLARSVSMATGSADQAMKRTFSDSGEDAPPTYTRQLTASVTHRTGSDQGYSSSLISKPSMALANLMYLRSCSKEDTGYDKLMRFVTRYHDLFGLKSTMKQMMRLASLRATSLEFFEWLLLQVNSSSVVHDILWQFVRSVSDHPMVQAAAAAKAEREEEAEKEEKDSESKDLSLGKNPLTGLDGAGLMMTKLRDVFHSFLQTIANKMSKLPVGSVAQQIALRCWCLDFQALDHTFLLQSKVFANISEALSVMEEVEGDKVASNKVQDDPVVQLMVNILPEGKLKVSSNDGMSNSLTDGSTETFWESRDEPRGKPRTITISYDRKIRPFGASIHIDNTKDSGQRLEQLSLLVGPDEDGLKEVDKCKLNTTHSGWKTLNVPEDITEVSLIRFELRGAQNNVRARQVAVLEYPDSTHPPSSSAINTDLAMQKDCEAEALRLFRLLTSQVFGGLLDGQKSSEQREETDTGEQVEGGGGVGGGDEETSSMANILFNKSKLSNLQKAVCQHIMDSVHKETCRIREEWEESLKNPQPQATPSSRQASHDPAYSEEGSGPSKGPDAYCSELLTMLSGLSQNELGCTYLANQGQLVQDLTSLLHTASAKIQLQVCSLLRFILPYIKPREFATMTNVTVLPPLGYSAIAEAVNSAATINQLGLLDCLLAIIAKALSVQVKVKGRGSNILQKLTGDNSITAVTLATLKNPKPVAGETHVRTLRWYLQGSIEQEVAVEIVKLLKDMTKSVLKGHWKDYAKSAIGQAVLHLTKVNEEARNADPGMYSHTFWLCLAALCVIDEEHAEALSSGQWLGQDGKPQTKPLCDNHDDGETKALILCDMCGNLCGECDRVLHYHKRNQHHQRQVFKEEEEAVKVDLHEGCGRIKLYWTMALADSRTLKGMVEFKDTVGGGGKGACRFCGTTSNTGLLAIGNICPDPECQERSRSVCTRTLSCGHYCGGVKDEKKCLPCLHGCAPIEGGDAPPLKQDADDMCMICYTEGLSCAPAIQLECGHVFHYHCCFNALSKKWSGPRITFRFMFCSICEDKPISHPHLEDVSKPLTDLYSDVMRKCLLRLEYENQTKCEAITSPTSKFYQKPQEYAMWKYAYYVCYKCKKAYYGGEAHCAEAVGSDDYDPTELVCPSCSNTGGQLQVCPKHGTDFLEYKCRYCCSVAVYFCFGTTHFCNACHDDFQRVTSIARSDLPQCPVGPRAKPLSGSECPLHVKHPPTGEEFALGCGVCRNAQTF